MGNILKSLKKSLNLIMILGLYIFDNNLPKLAVEMIKVIEIGKGEKTETEEWVPCLEKIHLGGIGF